MPKIEMTISQGYVNDWGKWEGIRDLAQNVRDAVVMHGASSEFAYSERTKTLVMTSRGATMDGRALLLGMSSKRGNAEAAGQYGEGMKLAFLALVRAGCEVNVRTGEESWTPKIERSEQFGGEQVLVIHTRKVQTRNEVEVKIVGIEPDEWKLYRERLLFVSPPLECEQVETWQGTLLLAERYHGKVFVKGIWVCDSPELSYGYDLPNLKIDRDRRIASGWDIRWESTQVLTEASKSKRELAKSLYRNAKTGKLDGSGSLAYTGEVILDALVEEFDAEHGEGAVAVATEDEANKIRYLGGIATVVSAENLRTAIEQKRGRASSVVARLANDVTETFPRESLTEDERRVLDAAEFYMKVIGVEVYADVVTFRDPRKMGLASLSDGKIQMSRSSLDTTANALRVLVHEAAHVRSGAGDATTAHTAEIERLWSALFNATL